MGNGKQRRMWELIILVGLTACTSKKAFQPVLKEDVVDKSMISTTETYLYVPSVVESDRRGGDSRPFWLGEQKLTQFRMEQNALRVVEIDPDPRFQSNPANEKTVLSIPIDHKDFTCNTDSYGDCTNIEIDNNKVAWNEKSKFVPHFDSVKISEVNFLPVDLRNLFGNCYSEEGAKVVNYKFEADAVNFEVERNYKTSIDCAGGLESLSDLTYTVRNHYSMVKLSSMTSPNYQPFTYQKSEETTFGYFTSIVHKLDVDNGDTVASEKTLLNRWLPGRTVVYHLSSAFNKPENATLKVATSKSFEVLNKALEQAGTTTRLQLQEPLEGVSIGDIRHNHIVLVEDPQAISVIGYGPTIANPYTGEILHGRTVMYLGTIKKYVQRTYDELVEEIVAESQPPPPSSASSNAAAQISAKNERSAPIRGIANAKSLAERIEQIAKNALQTKNIVSRSGHALPLKESQLMPKLQSEDSYANLAQNLQNRTEALSRHSATAAEMFNFHEALREEGKTLIKSLGLKPWAALSDAQKQAVLEKLTPFVWIPTLVHEMGHNLGLRHNFAGSNDKENFYSADELKQMGIKKPIPYSSVMDYSYRTSNELPTMGKYDVAALRFAYAEKIETSDGKMVSVADFRKNPGIEIKPYGFCTDEHVSANPNCNRFDEGTTLTEIALHLAKAYEADFAWTHTRHDRRNYSLYNDIGQLARMDSTFRTLRLMYERYETIKNKFELPDDRPEWQLIPFLADLKMATLVSGVFMAKVIETPDVQCAVATKDKPNELVAIVPLRAVSVDAISCFDPMSVQLREPYIVVGEGGKSFQSAKDPNSNNPYVDQIDVRGVWIEKMLAAKYLFSRNLNSTLFDDYTDNFLYVPELAPMMVGLIRGILLDEHQDNVVFSSPGGAFQVAMNYSLRNSHKIEKSLSPATDLALGLPLANTTYTSALANLVLRELPQVGSDQFVQPLIQDLRVSDKLPEDGTKLSDLIKIKDGADIFYAKKSAGTINLIVTRLSAVQLLESVGEELIKSVIEELQKEQGEADKAKAKGKIAAAEPVPAPVPVPEDPNRAKVKALGLEMLLKYVNGELQSSQEYLGLIRTMVDVNKNNSKSKVSLEDILEAMGKERGYWINGI